MDSNYLDVYLSEKWVKGEIQKWTILLTFYKKNKTILILENLVKKI